MNEPSETEVEADNADALAWSWSPPGSLPDCFDRLDTAPIEALDPERWRPVKQLAYELGITAQGLRDRARVGRFETKRVGGRVLIDAPSARQHHRLVSGRRD